MTLKLHGYWRSGAAWRVRIGLALKGLEAEAVPHNLLAGEQGDPAYLALNPQGLVPALETDLGVITQSLAILEWLEERYPDPALLPADAMERAQVRAMTMVIACDIHPLNNLRVLQSLRHDLGASKEQVADWTARWISRGFTALETMIERRGGRFAFGDNPTQVDCFLVPQVYSARRYGVPLDAFPRIVAIADHCDTLPAFARAHPDQQVDAA